MTPADIDRVFGRSRLKMVTGAHVEVFREEALPGERRRYTKRFLATAAGDFRQWTEREWRILARLVGHGIGPVPDVVQFDRGAADRPALVQTYDAGITVDHWATLLPVERDGAVMRHVFEDCAHWWALARHCLIALDAIHQLQLVHLDLKADNVCIPAGPADFDPRVPGASLHLRFEQIALIDFAFSLVSGEQLVSALPIARQTEYDYQSPRLLDALEAGARGDVGPTRQLDWRCDVFSLAAMLRRYLPDPDDAHRADWTGERHALARALVRRLLEVHDAALPVERPHAALIALASEPLHAADLVASLQRGWTLAAQRPQAAVDLPTPVTRIAMPVPTPISMPTAFAADPITIDPGDVPNRPPAPMRRAVSMRRRVAWTAGALAIAAIGVPVLGETWRFWQERSAAVPAGNGRAGVNGAQPEATVAQPEVKIAQASPDVRPAAVDAVHVAEAAAGANPVSIVASPPIAAASTPATAAASTPPTIDSSGPPASVESKARQGDEPAASNAAGRAEPEARPAVPSPDVRAGSASNTRADRSVNPAGASRTAPARAGVAATSTGAATGLAQAARHGGAAATRQAVRVGAAGASALAPTRRTASVAGGRGVSASGAKAAASAERAATARASERRIAAAKGPAPSAAKAPTPWPHTAMASGIGNARSSGAPPSASTSPPTALPTVPARMAEASAGSGQGTVAPHVPNEAPTARNAAPVFVPSPPAVVATAAPVEQAAPLAKDFNVRAGDLLANQLPRIAQRAERSVMRVLFVAARADDAAQADDVRQAASAMHRPADDALTDAGVAANDARLLNEAARVAFWRRGSAREATDLQMRAFGANPADAEVAGNLAFLRLKQQPGQPEVARQLALHALTLPDARYPHGRIEDWTTLAIASALAGRERDARNAWWVTVALAPSIQRQCRAATDAYALYGERLRGSVEALLYRLHASGRLDGSPYCSWPPYWTVGAMR